MSTLNYLHLNEGKVDVVVESLSRLLADLQVYYTNLRGLHWNVKGRGFFSLHAKYEELYDEAAEQVDEVAERILQLGGRPENRFSEYLKVARIKEDGFEPAGHDGIQKVLGMLSVLIAEERELSAKAAEAGDEVTVALADDYLKRQEKQVWMFDAFLAQKPGHGEK